MKVGFQANGKHAPVVAFALYEASTVILRSLCQQVGRKDPWFDKMREAIKKDIKNSLPGGMSDEDHNAALTDALAAVDAVFARIKWVPES